MRKANNLEEIDQAVKFNEPIGPDHEFFIDFSQVRGNFDERMVYRSLNVKLPDFTYDAEQNALNKSILFIAGMRGTGKTSELAKYAKKLNGSDCFLCITCNIDEELDMNNIEYIDILIFQLEKLIDAAADNALIFDEGILNRMQKWFGERVQEINKNLKGETSIEIGVEAGPTLPFIGKLFAKLKAGVSASTERANSIRTVFKNRFNDFAEIFNIFIENVNLSLRRNNVAQEVLFIIDGLEKTMSADLRRKVILDEYNRIGRIKANTIFTLPIELMREQDKLRAFSTVSSFPYVKIVDINGDKIPETINKFREFIYKRIDTSLFENEELVEEMICLGGGSPRELLRLVQETAFFADEEKGVIDKKALDRAKNKLGADMVRFITDEQWAMIKKLYQNNANKIPTAFNDTIQDLLERLILLEYNDGSYKRVHPLIEITEEFNHYVKN